MPLISNMYLGVEWLTVKDITNEDPQGLVGLWKLQEKNELPYYVCSTNEKQRSSRTVCNRCSGVGMGIVP